MIQRYEVKGKLGHGGLGEVYLAYDTQLDRDVALKRVKPTDEGEESAQTLAVDLVREAKTLSALQHPNIVTIYDVGRDEKGPYVIMEYLKGETLDEVIERGKISVEDFSEVVLQVMEGMVAAQALGLVHRDLKTGNIMVNWLASGKLQLKILDFGLAKFSRLAVPQTQDQGEGIFGSIFFMAPEQFERLPLDSRTDMYSLGCIFYQLLTQKHPFDGHTPVDVMVSHLQHLVTPIHELRTDLPAWMADWVMWLIGREMDERPADAQTALEYFNAHQSGLPAAPPMPKAPVVKVVGRGSAPTPHHTHAVHIPQRAVPARGGSHSSAVSSRAYARRATGRVRGIPKSKLHWSSVLTGFLIVGAAFGIFWHIYKDGTKGKDDPRFILTKLTGDAPQGGPDTVKALVKLAGTGSENARDVLAVLKKLKGQGVPQTIAAELQAAKAGPVRDMLMEAAAAQPLKESLTTLVNIAITEPGDARTKALEALATGGTPSDAPELLMHATKFTDENSRKTYYKTIETLLAKQPNRDDRARALAPTLRDAPPGIRASVYRLLGACGSSEANNILGAELRVGGARRAAALEALNTWNAPDAALAETLLKAAKEGDRDVLTGAYCRTVTRVPSMTGAEIVAALRDAVPLADSEKARAEFAAALGTLGSPEAAAFAAELAGGSDAVMAAAVKPVVEKIKKQAAQATTLTPGDNILDGKAAVIFGDDNDAAYSDTVRYITGWRSPKTRIAWDIVIASPLTAEVIILQSAVRKEHHYFFSLANETIEKEVTLTKGTDDFARVSLGKFTLPRTGSWRIWLEPGRATENEALVNVRNLTVKVE